MNYNGENDTWKGNWIRLNINTNYKNWRTMGEKDK